MGDPKHAVNGLILTIIVSSLLGAAITYPLFSQSNNSQIEEYESQIAQVKADLEEKQAEVDYLRAKYDAILNASGYIPIYSIYPPEISEVYIVQNGDVYLYDRLIYQIHYGTNESRLQLLYEISGYVEPNVIIEPIEQPGWP